MTQNPMAARRRIVSSKLLEVMVKTPRKDEIKDEPGAEDRFLRGVQKAVNTPPKPFTKKAKGKEGKRDAKGE